MSYRILVCRTTHTRMSTEPLRRHHTHAAQVLLQIWSLADVDGHDRLDLRGYLLCCWLVQRSVQKQLPPPTSLPPELLASATGAVAPPTELRPAARPLPAVILFLLGLTC